MDGCHIRLPTRCKEKLCLHSKTERTSPCRFFMITHKWCLTTNSTRMSILTPDAVFSTVSFFFFFFFRFMFDFILQIFVFQSCRIPGEIFAIKMSRRKLIFLCFAQKFTPMCAKVLFNTSTLSCQPSIIMKKMVGKV